MKKEHISLVTDKFDDVELIDLGDIVEETLGGGSILRPDESQPVRNMPGFAAD